MRRISHAAEIGLLFAAFVISSCTNVTESTLIRTVSNGGSSPPSCHSALGSYYLPKSYIKFQIDRWTAPGSKRPDYVLHDLAPVVLPDRHGFCLDYLASSFADDWVAVTKSNSSSANQNSQQLLKSVSSSAVDQTAIIIRKLIRAAFTLMSATGFRVAGTDPTQVTKEPVSDVTFDPFDQYQSAVVNDSVRHFGFCFILESFTFGAPDIHRDAQAYCKNPMSFVRTPSEFAQRYAEFENADIPPRGFGIMYKPRASYELSIYVKDDPDGPGRWLLRRTQRVDLENISPVISINIDRAMFTEKQIALEFDQGDLVHVCIFKKSELAQVVLIPLEVVRSIVALPTQIMQVQYDQITESSALVTAENGILASQSKTISLLTSPSTATSPGNPGGRPAFPDAPSYTVPGTPTAPDPLKRTTDNTYQSCMNINSTTAVQAVQPVQAKQ